MTAIVKMPGIGSSAELIDRLHALGFEIPVSSDAVENRVPGLGRSIQVGKRLLGNRFAILPMEGWDAEVDGRPSELVARRWINFANSGAKLLWGCEAAAVTHACRANPHQLVIDQHTIASIADLHHEVRSAHAERFGSDDDLAIGLQLTHSGRWSRPDGVLDPKIAYRHPDLDVRVGATDEHLVSDKEIDELIDIYIDRAGLAAQAGFDFVDIKHCHGYFAHELLSAVSRPGKYGGSLHNRMRFLREVVRGIKQHHPLIDVGVRLSAYDFVSFSPDPSGVGRPVVVDGDFRFGMGGDGVSIDLSEPVQFLAELESLGVNLVCVTAGSPYYNPHIQRPALYPPSDGYKPPEDPLVGVARMIQATAELKSRFPSLIFVGSGYTYLQEWLPHVAEALIVDNQVDIVGIGRMALSYPEMPADLLSGRGMTRKKICRTFSDCTTAPRHGLISGCYPLDPFYKSKPEASRLKAIKYLGSE